MRAAIPGFRDKMLEIQARFAPGTSARAFGVLLLPESPGTARGWMSKGHAPPLPVLAKALRNLSEVGDPEGLAAYARAELDSADMRKAADFAGRAQALSGERGRLLSAILAAGVKAREGAEALATSAPEIDRAKGALEAVRARIREAVDQLEPGFGSSSALYLLNSRITSLASVSHAA